MKKILVICFLCLGACGIAGSMSGHGKGSDLMAIAGGTVGALVGGAVGGVAQQAATSDKASFLGVLF